jgi:hypothetical protein
VTTVGGIFLILVLICACRNSQRKRELTSSEAAAIAAVVLYARLAPEQRARAEDYVRNMAAENR